ncbi:right-handed parallel beta-helix repeat-containing protein [Rossellomorea marisflavi]|uniref:right-handed parallel beta-helix repeat-containing protein n=1 Tax=Rossellomorea marisflavi TaxID=189381 RepID=UPI00285362CD|nr:right-handed parallel beta-helix repeat-containing protein [Rossellomorea marisflavi]MDR4938318.1 right-handed parallel beta-helix repeat-containing protein [Rossellomorea marisflavi]
MRTIHVSNKLFSRFRSVQSAIDHANPGDTVLVDPGTYQEAIHIEKPIIIKGHKRVTLAGEMTIHSNVTLDGISIAGEEGDQIDVGVSIQSGHVMITDCSITRTRSIGILVNHGASLEIHRSTISHTGNAINAKEKSTFLMKQSNVSHCTACSIWCVGGSVATIEDCQLADSEYAHVLVKEGSRATIHQSSIHSCQSNGVLVRDAELLMTNCELYGNNLSQVSADNSQICIKDCHIHQGKEKTNGIHLERSVLQLEDSQINHHDSPQLFSKESRIRMKNSLIADGHSSNGIRATDHSNVDIDDCTFYQNGLIQLAMESGSHLSIQNSIIHSNEETGIHFRQSDGQIIDCEIYQNRHSQLAALDSSTVKVIRSKIHDSKEDTNGVYVGGSSTVTIEDCTFKENHFPQVYVTEQSRLKLSSSTIHDGKGGGVYVTHSSVGEMDECECYANGDYPQVKTVSGSEITINHCRIHHGEGSGVILHESKAVLDDCSLFNNHLVQLDIAQNSFVEVNRSHIYEGFGNGVRFRENSSGLVEDVNIHGHTGHHPQVVILSGGDPTLRRCNIFNGGSEGILIDNGMGTIEECNVYDHPQSNVVVLNNSEPILRRNRILKANGGGIDTEGASPIIEDSLYEHTKDEVHTEDRNSTREGSDSLEEWLSELDQYIGLTTVKETIHQWVNILNINRVKKQRGLKTATLHAPHIIFYGNPGTGKTTIARLMGKIFHALGLLDTGHLVEVRREDLVGQVIGDTEKNTKEKIEEAMGGVLLIDEAYTLVESNQAGSNDFGLKAINVLLPALTNHAGEFVAIVTGYKDEMDRFLGANPGLKDRFNRHIQFDDYTPDELMQIFHKCCKDGGYTILQPAEDLLREAFIHLYRKRDKTFGNARLVNKYFDEICAAQTNRIATIPQPQWDDELLTTLTEQDVTNVFRSQEEESFDVPINEELLQERLEHLNSLIGLQSVKEEIHQLVGLVRYYKKTGQSTKELIKHTLLLGNPGTGKTEVARILAGIYEALGILERGDLMEVDRNGLIDQYRGGTEEKTAQVIQQAQGGTLFIDEAYTLTNKDRHDPGHTAIEIILKRMSDWQGRFLVIAAGYHEEMKQFLDSNSGLRRRFGLTLIFDDYTPEELMEISSFYLNGNTLSQEAEQSLRDHFQTLYHDRSQTFGNAGLARKIISQAIQNRDYRLANQQRHGLDELDRRTIVPADISYITS